MDSQKFGTFISELRKERGWTQLELAQKLNVTDKAVSKWERGAGFPDIKLIEPLADALGVSVLEIMKSEKICEPKILTENANETMSQIIDIAILQKKIEKRNLAIGIICAALAVAIVFLLDLMDGIGFFMVYLPVFAVAMGVVIGNEGEGVSRLVKEKCDFVAAIPMKGDIDSLNASVAAGILAYEVVRQRMK